jgi:polar amino acid transport system substrate-binding protein
MKKCILLTIVVIFALSFSNTVQSRTLEDIKKAGKIVIGVKGDYPPWGVINQENQFEGWEIDLCHKLAEKLFGDPNKVEFVAVTGGNRVPFLTSGKIDIIWATMGITPERKKVVDFSIPYFKSGVQLLTKKDSGINDLEDLKGKTVITIKGTTGAQGIEKLVPDAKQIKFDKTSEALQALRNDRGVAFAQDDILLFKLVQNDPSLRVTGRVFNETDWAVGFRKGEEDIKAFVNQTIKEMGKSGYMTESLKKWWAGQEMEEYIERIEDLVK